MSRLKWSELGVVDEGSLVAFTIRVLPALFAFALLIGVVLGELNVKFIILSIILGVLTVVIDLLFVKSSNFDKGDIGR